MPSDHTNLTCRLCQAPLSTSEPHRLCPICDEYAQHVALNSDKKFDRILGELQDGALFLAAMRNAH